MIIYKLCFQKAKRLYNIISGSMETRFACTKLVKMGKHIIFELEIWFAGVFSWVCSPVVSENSDSKYVDSRRLSYFVVFTEVSRIGEVFCDFDD